MRLSLILVSDDVSFLGFLIVAYYPHIWAYPAKSQRAPLWKREDEINESGDEVKKGAKVDKKYRKHPLPHAAGTLAKTETRRP
jgi:hypothetical protein